MIPQAFIEEVQTRTDIAELIASYIPLKRAGRNFKALCPFHGEKTPSFFVNPQKQIFHCFGCSEGGGVIQFLMLYERVSFVEAVEILANRLGLEIPYQRGEKDKLKSVLYEATNEASLFFHKNLLDPSSKPIIVYLNKRGINNETIKQFRLGYAFGNNTLLDYMRKKGFTLQVLEKASLIISGGQNYRDLFQDRVTFPIFDLRSRVLGFGARVWKDIPGAPKYINSLESPLYSKREHLFGLNFSKDDIIKNDSAIIAEGYLDMIVPFMKGIRNIVASLGTSLTQEQISLIRRYTSNITLVFDPDKAGEVATLRALDLLLENDLKVKIARVPVGFDPDSLVREKGKDYFLQLLDKKVDFFDYKINLLKNIYDIESIGGKTKIAGEVFSSIEKLKSEIERYEYIKVLSQELKVKEEILIAEFRRTSKKSATPETKFSSLVAKGPLSITEKVLIKFMLTNAKAFAIIRKSLKGDEFTNPLARKTVSYFFKNYSDENTPLLKFLGTIEDKEISSFVSKVLMDDDIPLDKEQFKSSLQKLRQKRIKSIKDGLREEIKEAEARGDRGKIKVLVDKYDRIKSEVVNG
jgi:DNA primase